VTYGRACWRSTPSAANGATSAIVSYQGLCRELAASGPGTFGELDSVGARSVLRRYSDAWFAAARARGSGNSLARFPRRRRRTMPLRWYAGTFTISGRRLRLPVAKGAPPLWVRLDRDPPYPPGQIRSVTLCVDAGRLVIDVCAEVPVATHSAGTGPDPGRVAGVDLGIIHPYAVAGPGGAGLLVSGRALRAESRLHLAERKARARAVAARALDQRVGTLVVGDPAGVLAHDSGPRHNQRVRDWRPAQLAAVLTDKAEALGIAVVVVDERSTSSTCPACAVRVAKPRGRRFCCPHCALVAHRDLVGATNIAAKHPGRGERVFIPETITHRRGGRHLPGAGRSRRDPRRTRFNTDRARRESWPATARPEPSSGSRSIATTVVEDPSTRAHKRGQR